MRRQAFGKTGLDAPSVVFGTSNLGNLFRAYTPEEKTAVVRAWFRHVPPPVYIDTAGKYGAGLALESLGNSLRELGVAPEQVIISNKLAWKRVPLEATEPTFEPGAWVGLEHDARQQISYRGILECWEQGRELLGEPYRTELLSVHDPDEYLAAAASPDDHTRRLEDIVDAYRALAELRDRGEATAIGVGAKDWRVIQKIDALVPLDWVMIANSLSLYRHPPELLAFVSALAERGVGVINSAVFHAGFLVGGPYFDYREVSQDDPAGRELLDWRERLFALCERHGVAPARACVEFGLSPPGVAAIAMNSSRPERIAEDVAATEARAPAAFWAEAKLEGLIDPAYPHV